jgi:hypothetical protein
MSWLNRLKTAAFTSPSGVRTVFDYEDVELGFEKNASTYRFPGVDGAFIVSKSSSEKRYPLRCFISGTNYDLISSTFENSLYEKGSGLLEHPVYGYKTVQALVVRRLDELVSAANQATFIVDFSETVDQRFPNSSADLLSIINNSINVYNIVSSEFYSESINYDTTSNRLNSLNRWQNNLNVINEILNPVAQTNQKVFEEYSIVYNSLNANLDNLIFDPDSLARQFNILIEIPAEVESSDLKLQAYVDLIAIIESSTRVNYINLNSRNIVIESSLLLQTLIISMAKSSLYSEYKTKSEAIGVTDVIRDSNAFVTEVIELRERLFQIDDLDLLLYGDSDACKSVNNTVTSVYENLTQLSFSLSQERNFIPDQDRSLFDLCYELYGSADNETLDLFITSNNLQDEEIIQIPRGREVVYFV